MAKAQAGSCKRLNQIFGFTTTINVTEADKTAYGSKVYPAGTFLHDENGFLYHADGKMTLTEVLQHPIVNKNYDILTPAERKMITDFNKKNGFVATDENNKINDDQLKVVEGGQIVESYLSKYIVDGMIKPEVIPMDVRAHMKFLKTYEELESVEKDYRSGMFFVIDASGDPTVESGWAIYVWQYTDAEDPDAPGQDEEGEWKKIQEGEGIDYDYDSITTHDSVEKVGAVMYDHVLFMQSPTLDQLASLEDPIINPVFTTFKSTIAAYDKIETPLGASITTKNCVEGEHSIVFTVEPDATVTLKGFDEGDCTDGNPRTLIGTDANDLNTKLQQIKLVPGATGGKFTMVMDEYDSKTVTVTTTPFKEPTILNGEAMDVNVNQEVAFPAILSTDGVDPEKSYTVTVTPTGCSMKDDASGSVSDGSPWSVGPDTVANINTKLQKAKVIVAADGATINIAITEGASQSMTITTVWAEPTLEGSETLTAGDGLDVALGITVGTTNVNATKTYNVTVVSEGVGLKNDDAPVEAGTPIQITSKNVSELNVELAKIKVTGDSDGGTVTITIEGGVTKTVTVSAA